MSSEFAIAICVEGRRGRCGHGWERDETKIGIQKVDVVVANAEAVVTCP